MHLYLLFPLLCDALVRNEQQFEVSAQGEVSFDEAAFTELAAESSSEASTLFPHDLCSMARFQPGCAPTMFRQKLVFQVSADNVPSRTWEKLRGTRNMYTTVRVKQGSKHQDVGKEWQIGEKMRTEEIKTLSPVWAESFSIPVACKHMADSGYAFVEFNIKDTAVGITRPWSKQIAQVKLAVGHDFQGYQDRTFTDDGVNVHIRSAWCNWDEDVHDCLGAYERTQEAGSQMHVHATRHHRHPGLDCGQGCHNRLDHHARKNVLEVRRLVQRSIDAYHEEKRMDRQGDYHDREGDRADRQGDRAHWRGDHDTADHHRNDERHHQRQEDYYDRRERDAERRMERTWDQARQQLRTLDNVLQESCGSMMPELGLEQQFSGPWSGLSHNFAIGQANQLRGYLDNAASSINRAANCLRGRWFQGQFATVRDYPECSF